MKEILKVGVGLKIFQWEWDLFILGVGMWDFRIDGGILDLGSVFCEIKLGEVMWYILIIEFCIQSFFFIWRGIKLIW